MAIVGKRELMVAVAAALIGMSPKIIGYISNSSTKGKWADYAREIRNRNKELRDAYMARHSQAITSSLL